MPKIVTVALKAKAKARPGPSKPTNNGWWSIYINH